jgi:flagellar FliL protein
MRELFLSLCLLLGLALVSAAYAEEDADDKAPVKTLYFDIKPAFIANYGGAGGGKLRYLKTDLTLRVKVGTSGMADIRHHLPYIRHVLVMLFSRQKVEDLSSMEGRELLRQAALEEVQRVLMEEEGETFVLDLLFNSFIVQG